MKNQLFYNCVTGQTNSLEGFKPAGSMSIESAFAVYQRGYIARLTETLGDTFEFVWRVLGDDLFFETCEHFISMNGSQSYNLSDYSVKFIDYMLSHSATADFPFLPDLAHLGWLHKEVFHAAGENGLAGEELMTRLNEDAESIELTASFEILKSNYRLFDIWKAVKNDESLPENWQTPQLIAIYQLEHQVYLREINPKEFNFFESLRSGSHILDACNDLEPEEITSLFEFLGASRCLTLRPK